MARTQTAERAQTQAPPQQAPAGNLPAEAKPTHPLTVLKQQLEERTNEFQFALPEHIPVARFTRVILTAVQNNPRLLNCDRASFFNAAMRAAQDGLLPDGREGAIVDYKDNKTGKFLAQWMPMFQGLLKKVRNSGEFKWMTAQIVYEGDQFRHWIDQDGEHFAHEPAGISTTPVRAYSAVTTKSGGCFVEVMTVPQVKKVQAASRAKSEYGPWAKWWDEMAKKTAFRRLAKRLPISSDLDDLVRRDDSLYDFEAQREEAQIGRQEQRRLTTSQAFDRFASAGPVIDHDPETGEVHDDQPGDFGGDGFGEFDDQPQQQETQPEQEKPKAAAAKKEDRISSGPMGEQQGKPAASAAKTEAKAPAKKDAPGAATTAANDKSAATASPGGAAKPADEPETSAGAQLDNEVSDPGIDADAADWPPEDVPTTKEEYELKFKTQLKHATEHSKMQADFMADQTLRTKLGFNDDEKRGYVTRVKARMTELGWAPR